MPKREMDFLLPVLCPPVVPEAHASIGAWHRQHSARCLPDTSPLDEAIANATAVASLGYAFAGGYRAALHALCPALPRQSLVCLAATEGGSADPRQLGTHLVEEGEGFVLNGEKSFVTLGAACDELLVVAVCGQDALARPSLRIARIERTRPGLAFEDLPPLAFLPEIPHAKVTLTGVSVRGADLLPGNGFTDFLKPFRTIEDIHVTAAVLAYTGAFCARLDAPKPLREAILATLVGVRALAFEDPNQRALHVALAGLLERTEALTEEASPHFAKAPDLARRFARDRPILAVASAVRRQRLDRAWRKLDGQSL